MPLPLGHEDHSLCFCVPRVLGDSVTWTHSLFGHSGTLLLVAPTSGCPHFARTSNWLRHDQRGLFSVPRGQSGADKAWDKAEGSLGAWCGLGPFLSACALEWSLHGQQPTGLTTGSVHDGGCACVEDTFPFFSEWRLLDLSHTLHCV